MTDILRATVEDHPLTDWVTFNSYPPDDVRDLYKTWLTRHGIDPNHVAIPGWIGRNDELYQVRYETYRLDDAGNPMRTLDGEDVEREVVVVQLEGPPLPFPRPTWTDR